MNSTDDLTNIASALQRVLDTLDRSQVSCCGHDDCTSLIFTDKAQGHAALSLMGAITRIDKAARELGRQSLAE